MHRLIPLLISLLILAIPLTASAGAEPSNAPKLYCEHPRTLRLHRFEDHSAILECAGRVIVRISVPN